jgi:phosphonatase-like hydrolase
MSIRLVVFDVSGTTVHDGGGVVRRALQDALDRAGLSVREGALGGVAGLTKLAAIRTLIEGHGRDDLLPMIDSIHADFAARMRRWYRDSPDVREVPGAAATFASLRASGIKVGLASGFPREVLDVVLERLQWLDPSVGPDATVSSDEVRRGRPYPDMIDALCTRLGIAAPAEVAKVGDTAVDLQEGTMAGCGLVVGVLTGGHDRALLAQQPHDVLLESVAELPALLASRGLLPRPGEA